ncbi:MAG: HNH endonuclease signature motif containing protein [Acidimicrobiales bacterium]
MDVGGLHDRISDLAELDFGVLDDAALHDHVVGLGREAARLQLVIARHLREWEQRGIFERDGSKSAAHRLARELGASVTGRRHEMRRARHLDHMAVAERAVLDGRLSLDLFDRLAAVNTPARRSAFQRDQQLLVDTCTELVFFDAVKAIRYWANRVDDLIDAERPTESPSSDESRDAGHGAHGETGAPADDESRLFASRTMDDVLELTGRFGAIDGTIVERELDRLAELIREADAKVGITRTASQRRAAALVEMAQRSATAPADGRRPLPLFSVVVGSDTMDHLCELSNGIVIRPGELVPWITRSMLETILFSGPRTIISVSSKRTFTGALRRAIQVRDRRCQHRAGCDTPAEDCHVDHIIPWARGGPTSQFNGRAICEPQNVIPHLQDRHAPPLPEQQVNDSIALVEQLRWRLRREPPPAGMHLEFRWAPDQVDGRVMPLGPVAA